MFLSKISMDHWPIDWEGITWGSWSYPHVLGKEPQLFMSEGEASNALSTIVPGQCLRTRAVSVCVHTCPPKPLCLDL